VNGWEPGSREDASIGGAPASATGWGLEEEREPRAATARKRIELRADGEARGYVYKYVPFSIGKNPI
jgi:hypothetical protein